MRLKYREYTLEGKRKKCEGGGGEDIVMSGKDKWRCGICDSLLVPSFTTTYGFGKAGGMAFYTKFQPLHL